MRPWSLRPLTLGLAERIVLAADPDIIIRWRWWCRGFVRLPRWRIAAARDAIEYVNRQFKSASPSGVRRKSDLPTVQGDILEAACQAALALGGTPDQWRAALWADVRFMMDWRSWEARSQAVAMDKHKPAVGPPPTRTG